MTADATPSLPASRLCRFVVIDRRQSGRRPEREDRDLGTGEETDSKVVPQAAIDVEHSAVFQGVLAGHVAFVAHREFRRSAVRQATLAAMRVTRENPAAVLVPPVVIAAVGVMAKRQGGLRTIVSPKRKLGGGGFVPG